MQNKVTSSALLEARLFFSRMGRFAEDVEASFEIGARIHLFEALTWFPYLQSRVLGTKSRGMRGECRGIEIMTWCCAGRCLIQLQRHHHRLTLITAEDEKPWSREDCHVAPFMGPMGMQAVEADYSEVLRMLYEATRYGSEIKLVDDNDVHLAGF